MSDETRAELVEACARMRQALIFGEWGIIAEALKRAEEFLTSEPPK